MLGAATWANSATAQQTSVAVVDDGRWLAPINVSQSGAATAPQIVTDANGVSHMIWRNRDGGFSYSRGQGSTWRAPEVLDVPFSTLRFNLQPNQPLQAYTPQVVATQDGRIHAVWIGAQNTLYHASVPAASFADFAAWSLRLRVGQTVYAAALAATGNTLHMLTQSRTSGLLYWQANVGTTLDYVFGEPILLDDAGYIIDMDAASADLAVAATTTEDGTAVYAAYALPAEERLYFTRSLDNGATWQAPVALAARSADDRPDGLRPQALQLAAAGAQVAFGWQAGDPDLACRYRLALSADRGATFDEVALPPALAECPSAPERSGQTRATADMPLAWLADGTLELLLLRDGERREATLVRWDGARWSAGEIQTPLITFVHPTTFRSVAPACRQARWEAGQLTVISCAAGDVWVLARPLGDALFATDGATPTPTPTPVWQPTQVALMPPTAPQTLALFAETDSRLAAFWLANDGAVQAARFDGNRWSNAATVFGGPITAVQFAQTGDGRLLAVYDDAVDGGVYFSQAPLAHAVSGSEWATPVRIAPGVVQAGGDVAVTRGGRIVVAYSVPLNEGRGVYLVASEDDGDSWSAPQRVFDAADWIRVGPVRVTLSDDAQIYLLWTRLGLSDDSMAQGLYGAVSGDGGTTWSAPESVTTAAVNWYDVLGVGTRTLHRVWQERGTTRPVVYHSASVDNGVSWSRRAQVGSDALAAVLLLDGAARPNLLLAGANGVTQQIWQEERWQSLDGLTLDQPAAALGAALLPAARLAILYPQLVAAPDGADAPQAMQPGLIYTQRGLDYPAVLPTPLPTLTPTPTPSPTPSPTPRALPTATPTFPVEQGTTGLPALPGVPGGDMLTIVAVAALPALLVAGTVVLFGAQRWRRRRR